MDYIIAGAPQSGTTWVNLCLSDHPECYTPGYEELHFFDWHYNRGSEWYKQIFSESKEWQKNVDVCPHYMYVNNIENKIKNINSEPVIIFILRNPIERAYSNYCKELRDGVATKDVNREIDKYIEKSMYSKYLEKIDREFETEVFLYENMRKNNKSFISKLYNYIGVSSDFDPEWIDRKVNKNEKNIPEFMQRVSFSVSKFLGKYNVGKKLVRKIRNSNITDLIYSRIGSEYPRISKEKLKRMRKNLKSEKKYVKGKYGKETDKKWW